MENWKLGNGCGTDDNEDDVPEWTGLLRWFTPTLRVGKSWLGKGGTSLSKSVRHDTMAGIEFSVPEAGNWEARTGSRVASSVTKDVCWAAVTYMILQ